MPTESHSQQHEMRLVKTYPTGVEEWFCPMCGRRFVIAWPPAYKKIVLEVGDEYAIHNCNKGGMQLGSSHVREQASEPELSQELRTALEEVLRDIDLGD